MTNIVLAILLSGPFYDAAEGVASGSSEGGTPPQLLLFPYLFGDAGEELKIYHDNIVLASEDYGAPYALTYNLGTVGAEFWTYTPSSEGSETLEYSASGTGVTSEGHTTTLYVTDGAIATTDLLLVGDSLTDNSIFPVAVDTAVGVNVTFLGTQTDGGIPNEGNAGKAFCFFAEDDASPMTSAEDTLDISAYVTAIGATPDVISWMLGINGTITSSFDVLEVNLDRDLDCLQDMLDAWDVYDDTIIHGIVLPAPGNKRQSAFEDNYSPPTDSEWSFRRKVHRMQQKMISRWGASSGDGVWLVPSNISIDRYDGYPSLNAVHPDASGYDEVAAIIANFLEHVQ